MRALKRCSPENACKSIRIKLAVFNTSAAVLVAILVLAVVSYINKQTLDFYYDNLIPLIAGCVSIILISALICNMAYRFILPLMRFVQHMYGIDMKHLKKIHFHSVNKDIRILQDNYNCIVDKIRELQLLNTWKDRQRVRAELLMHIARINPHFLFNTLDSIRGAALKNNNEEISDMLRLLSSIVKYSIDSKAVMHQLLKEMEITRKYICIQKYRFKDRFEYFLDPEDRLDGCYVPKFIIQPLIENSLRHGFSSEISCLNIYVSVKREADDLIITVKDDGTGIPQERLDLIRTAMMPDAPGTDESSYPGIGLPGVHNRIRCLFGGQYGLTIENNHDRGVTNRICIPLIWEAKRNI